MWIIGCDLHTRYQQIEAMNTVTGEVIERRLDHAGEQVQQFYSALPHPVRVGVEATGYSDWFEQLLQKCGHELWVGNAAQIRASEVRLQKTDARQLLLHRSRLVSLRTSMRNQLQAVALGQGLRRKRALWSGKGLDRLKVLPILPFAAERRSDLLSWHDLLNRRITELDRQVAQQARRSPEAVRLMQQSGVGPVTSLAFLLTIGPVNRFRHSKQIVSYLGLNPRENSSGGHQRMGHISKQGNSMMRWLLVEAGQSAARLDPELKTFYRQLKRRRGSNVAKVAVARKLAVRLYWMLRMPEADTQRVGLQSSPGIDMMESTPSNS
jgi:transposase